MLNELSDVFSDAFTYLPFALLSIASPIWVVAFVLLAVISEMIGVVGEQIGASRRYDGPMGKSDRAVALSAIALIIFFGAEQGKWFDYAFMLLNGLLLMTIFNRGNKALKECS
jgi:CDP-diacylglycerol--glycerol-3-phosphate 3-phosphatidyltransferase